MRKTIITSIRVDRKLWIKAKIYAVKNGLTMRDLLETLIKMELEEKRIEQKIKAEKTVKTS